MHMPHSSAYAIICLHISKKILKPILYIYIIFISGLIVLAIISFFTYVKIPRVEVQRIDPFKPACIINAKHRGQFQVTVYRTYIQPKARNITVTATDPETNKTIGTWKLKMPPGAVATITGQTTAKCVQITVYVEGEKADQLKICRNTPH